LEKENKILKDENLRYKSQIEKIEKDNIRKKNKFIQDFDLIIEGNSFN